MSEYSDWEQREMEKRIKYLANRDNLIKELESETARLAEENKRLREALEKISILREHMNHNRDEHFAIKCCARDIAKAALEGE